MQTQTSPKNATQITKASNIRLSQLPENKASNIQLSKWLMRLTALSILPKKVFTDNLTNSSGHLRTAALPNRDLALVQPITDMSVRSIELNQNYSFTQILNNATLNFTHNTLDALSVRIENESNARLEMTLNCPEPKTPALCQKAADFKLSVYPRQLAQALLFLKPGPFSFVIRKTGFSDNGSGLIEVSRQDRLISAKTIPEYRPSSVFIDSLALQPGETIENQVLNDELCFETYLCEAQPLTISLTADETDVETKQVYFKQLLRGNNTDDNTFLRKELQTTAPGQYLGQFDFESGDNRVCLASTRFRLIDLETQVSISGQQRCDISNFFGWDETNSTIPATQIPITIPETATTSAPMVIPAEAFTPTPNSLPLQTDTTKPTLDVTQQPSHSPSISPSTQQPSMRPTRLPATLKPTYPLVKENPSSRKRKYDATDIAVIVLGSIFFGMVGVLIAKQIQRMRPQNPSAVS